MRSSSRAANSFFMIAGQFIGKGSLFVSVMLLSRYLSDSDFGALLFAIVLGQIYFILSDMGVSLVLNLRISMRPGNTQELLSTSMTIKLMLAILGLPLLVGAGLLMGMTGDRLLVQAVIGASVFFESFAEMYYSVFRAREMMLNEGISRTSKGLTGLGLIILATGLGADLVMVSLTYLARTLVAVTVAYWRLRRLGYTSRPDPDRSRMRELLLASLPLGIMGLVTVIHLRADTIVVRQMLGENAVAAWQQCLRITELMLLLVVPTLLPGALFPALCRSFRDGGYERETGDMARVFTAFAAALALGVASTGGRFLRFVWGGDYLRSFSPSELQFCLYFSIAGLGVMYLLNILVSSLMAVNKVRIVVPVTLSALVLVVAGNLLLIPVIGLPSAGVFFLAGNLLVTGCYWFFLRWRGFRLPVWKGSGMTLLVSMPFFALVPLTGRLPFIPALLVPAAAFVLTWWLTGGGDAVKRIFPLAEVNAG